MAINESPIPKDDPMMVAWDAFKQNYEFANAKYWATYMTIKQEEGQIASIEHLHVEGALWNAFVAGYEAKSFRT